MKRLHSLTIIQNKAFFILELSLNNSKILCIKFCRLLKQPLIMIILFTATFAFAQDKVHFSGYSKCDVIFSYICTNGTKLVLHLSYLIL